MLASKTYEPGPGLSFLSILLQLGTLLINMELYPDPNDEVLIIIKRSLLLYSFLGSNSAS